MKLPVEFSWRLVLAKPVTYTTHPEPAKECGGAYLAREIEPGTAVVLRFNLDVERFGNCEVFAVGVPT